MNIKDKNNKFLIGQLSDPNIKVLEQYFDKFIDLNNTIHWNLDTNILLINDKIYNPKSIFMRYNVFEESTWIKYYNFYLIRNYILINNIKEYNKKNKSLEVDKLYNLHVAKKIGLNTPETEYGVKTEKTNTILKPVTGGAHAVEGNESVHPSIIQQKIQGMNKRLFIIKNKTFCFDILSSTLDYRDDKNTTVEIGQMDTQTIKNSKKLTKKLNLNFCALDFINDGNTNWFLEVNNMPMFAAFNDKTNNALAETIYREL